MSSSDPNVKSTTPISSTDVDAYSICLVVCYFGECPAGAEVFFKSCAKNPTIDFLIFSDCLTQEMAPTNVSIHNSSLEDIRERASQTLGFPVSLDYAYKLCDFKPAFGHIFKDDLAAYDFWGMTDLDVIFGNLRRFISNELLEAFDVITCRQDYVVGHFTLYRNQGRAKTLYRESKDFERVFRSSNFYSFTECGKQWDDFRRQQGIDDEHATIDSITHVVNRLAASKKIRAAFLPLVREKEHLSKPDWLLCWDNGRLLDMYRDEEIMYLHYHLLPQKNLRPEWTTTPDKFYLDPQGYIAA